jgi:D-ribose pyranase
MKQNGILHPRLLDVLSAAGHGDVVVLADAGLRIPEGRTRIDLGLACGVPSMIQVVDAVRQELVIEAAVVATEFEDWNPEIYAEVVSRLPVTPTAQPHLSLMQDMAARAYAYVKTGECSAYSSVALVCGVNYLNEAVELYMRLHPDRPSPF